MREPSDDELIARTRRRFRESLIVGLLFGLAMAALVILYSYADRNGFFLRLGLTHVQTERIFPWVLSAVGITLAAIILIRYWQPKAERAPRLLRKDLDNVQKRGRWLMLIFSAVALEQTAMFVFRPHVRDSFTAAATIFTLCVMATLVSFGPGWLNRTYRKTVNDELMRELRAKAVRFGYLVAMLALAAAYFVLQYRPQAAAAVLIGLLCAGGVLPALYFTVLDWRSEHNRDG